MLHAVLGTGGVAVRERIAARATRARRRRDGRPAPQRRRSRRAPAEAVQERRRRSDPRRVGTRGARPRPPDLTVPASRARARRAACLRAPRRRNRDARPRPRANAPLGEARLSRTTRTRDDSTRRPLGGVRNDESYRRCQDEALAVARAEGAQIDAEALRALAAAAPDGMQSSMQKDIAPGRSPELDAIAGPILRGGDRHAIPLPATTELVRLVNARASS
jgi:hypothetical protein